MKLEYFETCRRYESAPGVGFQLSVGLQETPVELSAGPASTGAVGGVPLVVVARIVPLDPTAHPVESFRKKTELR